MTEPYLLAFGPARQAFLDDVFALAQATGGEARLVGGVVRNALLACFRVQISELKCFPPARLASAASPRYIAPSFGTLRQNPTLGLGLEAMK